MQSLRRKTIYTMIISMILMIGSISPIRAMQHFTFEPPTHLNSSNSPTDFSPLPRRCTTTTPGGSNDAACCLFGYVYLDGIPKRGASVTITGPNGISLLLTTEEDSEVPYAYFSTSLSEAPLSVQVGDILTIKARYSSHESIINYQVRSGSQHVDLILARNFNQDYQIDQEIIGLPEDGKFNDPKSVDTDSLGNVYVLDKENATVQKFNPNRQLLKKWGRRGVLIGEFRFPERLYIDRYDSVFVVDTQNHRIQKFNSNGQLILQFGRYGTQNGFLDRPIDMVTDAQGRIYVADRRGIHIFQSEGHYQTTWTSVKPTSPFSPPIYHLGIETTGNIVGYTHNPSISVYDPSGTLLRSWNVQAGGFIFATDIDIGPDNTVYISDGYHNSPIHVYSSIGTLLRLRGISGIESDSGQIQRAESVARNIDGSLIIVDSANSISKDGIRIHRYRDADNVWIDTWANKSKASGQFMHPQKVRTFGTKTIVFDAGNDRIEVFNQLMNRELSITSNNVDFVYDFAIDANNNYYVAMYDLPFGTPFKIKKFSSTGQLVNSWTPSFIVRHMTEGPNNTMYILSHGTTPQKIIQINSNGQEIFSWELPLVPNNEYGFTHIAYGNGSIYTTYNGSIYKYSTNGQIQDQWSHSFSNISVEGINVDLNGNILMTSYTWGDTTPYNLFLYSPSGLLLSAWSYSGTMAGEVRLRDGNNPSFSSPAVDSQGRVYIADVENNRLQIFRQMTATQPIATIQWINTMNPTHGEDTLVAIGSGADSDEDGNPGTFTYRWYLDQTLIGTGLLLNIPASNLPAGSHELTLEVEDDEGQRSIRDRVPLNVTAPIHTSWTFLLYMVADSQLDGEELLRAMDRGFPGQGMLDRLQQSQQLQPNMSVQVVVQIDALGSGNTRRMTLQPNGTFTMVDGWPRESAMDNPDEIADFVQWGRLNHPADHYYMAILSHGNAYQGVAWDATSGPNAYLTISELRQALANASVNGAARIDVLHFDACLLGLIDVAYELRDYADYLIVSQNLGWTFFLQDRYWKSITSSTLPRELSQNIVNIYANFAEAESIDPQGDQYPYTISALDLSNIDYTVDRLDAFARELGAFSIQGTANRNILNSIRELSQKFDSDANNQLTSGDEYVDLFDFANRVKNSNQISSIPMKDRATDVIVALKGATPLILIERDSENRFHLPASLGNRSINLSGTHGISVYYPIAISYSIGTRIWYSYKTDQLFLMTGGTLDNWDEFLINANTALPPGSSTAPEPGEPPILPYTGRTLIFAPFVIR